MEEIRNVYNIGNTIPKKDDKEMIMVMVNYFKVI